MFHYRDSIAQPISFSYNDPNYGNRLQIVRLKCHTDHLDVCIQGCERYEWNYKSSAIRFFSQYTISAPRRTMYKMITCHTQVIQLKVVRVEINMEKLSHNGNSSIAYI